MHWWFAGRPALLPERTFTGTGVVRCAALHAGSRRSSLRTVLGLLYTVGGGSGAPSHAVRPSHPRPRGRGHPVAAQPRRRATAVAGGRALRIQRPDDLAKDVGRTQPH